MNKSIKRGLVLAASLATAASVGIAAPALAHDRSGDRDSYRAESAHSHATVSATITGIPSSVTNPRSAHRGAYFSVYKLDSTQTSLPATKPTGEGKRMGVHPANRDATTNISNGTLTGVLKFRGESSTTVRYAVYPSDGSSPVLVTVVTDANGVATATASGKLTASFSQSVADAAPVKRGDEGHGKHRGGHRGDRH